MALNLVECVDDAVKVKYALVSVFDKLGLDRLVRGLLRSNPAMQILSTGGTYAAIAETLGKEGAGRNLKQVSAYTGQPEMQGGLVKTLDFRIYLGLLSETYNPQHENDLRRTGAAAIDLVVVNLYPFIQTVAGPGVTVEEARTNIDIGGPCMLRAAAKNFLRVACVTDPADYDMILREMERSQGALSLQTRFELSRKAFAHVAAYDQAITDYFRKQRVDDVRRCYRVNNP